MGEPAAGVRFRFDKGSLQRGQVLAQWKPPGTSQSPTDDVERA